MLTPTTQGLSGLYNRGARSEILLKLAEPLAQLMGGASGTAFGFRTAGFGGEPEREMHHPASLMSP